MRRLALHVGSKEGEGGMREGVREREGTCKGGTEVGRNHSLCAHALCLYVALCGMGCVEYI